jgi:hypothetical protein
MLRSASSHTFTLGSFLLLAGLAIVAGCNSEANKTSTGSADSHAGEQAHNHPEKGPHNGDLIELGKEEYHAELIHDDATHKVTIYLLDWAAIKPVAIAEKELKFNVVTADKPLQFVMPASPQAGDPSGQSSRFELTDEKLCEALDDPKTKARLNVTIAGKPFSGEVTAHDHAHHDHK